MARCGCSGTCTCALQGGPGIAVSGAGALNNPYTARFDPRQGNIVGPGLVWTEGSQQLSALVSGDADNGLTIGSDNGLYAPPGDGGGTPGTPGVSVATLPAQDAVGGLCGAGYLLTPENLLRSYQRAAILGLDMAHVPVRALRDGTAAVCSDVWVERITDGLRVPWYGDDDRVTDLYLDQFTPQQWAQLPQVASRYSEDSFDVTTGLSSSLDPRFGYFGYREAPQQGGTFAADVARLVGGKTVLVWELMDADNFPDPTDLAGDSLRDVIRRYGLVQSSIVISTDVGLLAPYRAMGVATGALIANASQLATNTPQVLADNGVGWVFLDEARDWLTAEQVASYVDAGLQVMAYRTAYQSEFQQVRDWGMRGALAVDPVYYGAPRTGTYSYRHAESRWETCHIEPGHYSPELGLRGAQAKQRGDTFPGQPYLYLSGEATTWLGSEPDAGNETTGPWWLQPGWLGPLPNADVFTLAFWVWWRHIPGYNAAATDEWANVTPGHQVRVAFGVQDDHALRSGPQAGWKRSLDAGFYVAGFDALSEDGTGKFEDHRPNLSIDTYSWLPGLPSFEPETTIRTTDLERNQRDQLLAVRVNRPEGTIRLEEATVDANGHISPYGDDWMYTHTAVEHTGPYVYFGKGHPQGGPVSDFAIRNVRYVPGDATTVLADIYPEWKQP